MSQTSIKLKLRPSTVDGKKGSIYIQFIKGRNIKVMTTSYKVYKEEWNTKKEAILFDSSNHERAMYLAKIASSLQNEIKELKNTIRHMEDTRDCTLEDIFSLYSSRKKSGMLSAFVEKQCNLLLENGQERTARAYRTALNGFLKFNGGTDIRLDNINGNMIRLYEASMKKKNNSMNTISFYLRNLRAIYNKAIQEKIIERKNENPFEGTYTGVSKTRKRAVKKEVLEKLMKLNLLDDKTQKFSFARDMFLLSFYMRGISFIDLAFLKKENIKGKTIIYKRRKTGQRLEIAITSEMQEIIKRYASLVPQNSEYLLPIIKPGNKSDYLQYVNALRNQNNRLYKISRMIRMEGKLTSYVSRHSWATIAKEKGIPISLISLGLGHESEKTTMIYLDACSYSNLHEANKKIINYTKKVS